MILWDYGIIPGCKNKIRCSEAATIYNMSRPHPQVLPIPKIQLIFGHGVKRPCDLDL